MVICGLSGWSALAAVRLHMWVDIMESISDPMQTVVLQHKFYQLLSTSCTNVWTTPSFSAWFLVYHKVVPDSSMCHHCSCLLHLEMMHANQKLILGMCMWCIKREKFTDWSLHASDSLRMVTDMEAITDTYMETCRETNRISWKL